MNAYCLVLDNTWQPSRIIDLKHAVLLLLSGKAIAVSDVSVGVMRSPSIEVTVPAVIQVRTLIRNIFQGDVPECSRRRILIRDDHECQFVINDRGCVAKADTVDHLLPRSRGGEDSWENLVAACFKHNTTKDDHTLEEMASKYDWKIKRKPVAPKFMLKSLATVKQVHPEWDVYLQLVRS